MPRLEDLKQDLRSMTTEELRAKIREIREDRVIRKDSGRTKAKVAKTKDTVATQLNKLLGGMTEEQIAAFLEGLD